MLRPFLAALLSFACTLAVAASKEEAVPMPAWAGVWEGTLGTSRVRLCLQPSYDETPSGAYYYTRYLRLIPLTAPRDGQGKGKPATSPLVLTEALPSRTPIAARPSTLLPEPATAAWSLKLTSDGQALEGQWHGQGKHWPVHLVQSANTDEADAPCSSDTFNAPREAPARLTSSQSKVKGAGTAYRALTLDFGNRFGSQIRSFELLREDNGTRRFNEAQRKALLAEQGEVFSCTRNVLSRFASAGDYHRERVPTFIGRQWLGITENASDDCGGAHPNASMSYSLWQLEVGGGRKVDPWSWFHPKGATVEVAGQGEERYTTVHIGKKLKAELRKVWSARADAECRTVITEFDASWDLYPTSQGMVFMPVLPHVVYACTDEVTLPWAGLLPLLNEEGRRAVSAIRADLAQPPSR